MSTDAMSSLRGRNLGLVAFAIFVMMAMVALPLLGSASTFSAGFHVVEDGRPVSDDLYIAGFQAEVRSDVEGDVSVAAVRAELDSTIGGSVHVLGGTTTIRGSIGGTLYVVSGITRLDGTVSGNVVMAGGRLELRDNARIEGDLIIFGAQAAIDGDVGGKLYGSTLLYNQDGSVSGNLELQADRISLGEQATIGDDFRYQSQTNADIHVNTSIGGDTTRTNSTPWNGVGDGALAPFGMMLRLVWGLVLGAVLITLIPRAVYRVADYAAPFVAPSILGTLGLFLIPVVAVLCFLSVLLLPVGALLLVLLPIALYLSQLVVSVTIGRAILPRKWRDGSRGYLLLAMVLGMIVIGALRMAPVPFLNAIVVVIVSIWGFGAIISLANDLTAARARISMRR